MTICYCCTRKATHRIYNDLKPVCNFHYDEALEEENGPILVMKIDTWGGKEDAGKGKTA